MLMTELIKYIVKRSRLDKTLSTEGNIKAILEKLEQYSIIGLTKPSVLREMESRNVSKR